MYRFHVPAMTCDGCARAITRSIQALDNDARVSAFPRIHRVDVTTQLSKADLISAFQEAGYAEGLEEQLV
jgi:copper chaperone